MSGQFIGQSAGQCPAGWAKASGDTSANVTTNIQRKIVMVFQLVCGRNAKVSPFVVPLAGPGIAGAVSHKDERDRCGAVRPRTAWPALRVRFRARSPQSSRRRPCEVRRRRGRSRGCVARSEGAASVVGPRVMAEPFGRTQRIKRSDASTRASRRSRRKRASGGCSSWRLSGAASR